MMKPARSGGIFGSVRHASVSNVDSEQEESIEQELERRFAAAYDAQGVDRSLIRWNLARTPTERVRAVEEMLSALATVRRVNPR